jgi:hypothetical protein
MIELTDAAVIKAAEKAKDDGRSTISFGITSMLLSGLMMALYKVL